MAVFKVRLSEGELRYHDEEAYFDVANYIFDPFKTAGKYIGGISDDPTAVAYQMQSLAQFFNNDQGVRIRHMILSFDQQDNIRPYEAFEIAKSICRYYQNNYQLIYAVHEDHDAPHIHIMMSMVNYNTGLKYDGSTKDYNSFINHIGTVLYYPYRVKFMVNNYTK